MCNTSWTWQIYLQGRGLTLRGDTFLCGSTGGETVLSWHQHRADALLPASSLPLQPGLVTRDDSWHHSYKIRALGYRSKESQSVFLLFDPFFHVLILSFTVSFSCPCFAVFLSLSFSFTCSALNDSQLFPRSFLSLSCPCFPGQCDASSSPGQVTFTALSASTSVWSDCWCARLQPRTDLKC